MSTTSLRHPLTRALLVLTITTGVIDAASYLGLGHVFTANMTGNIVFLGFGIAGGSGLPVISPLVSLAAFLIGAAFGGRMAGTLPVRTRHFSRSMLIEIGVVSLAAVLALVLDVTRIASPATSSSRSSPSAWVFATRPYEGSKLPT